MPSPRFPHKPPVPSVKTTIGRAIERSRALLHESDRPMSEQDLVRDILAKLDLPEPVRRQLRRSLEPSASPPTDKAE